MNGPRRLAESDDRAMRLVMDAALSESAPSGGKQRALAALGVATATAGAATGAKAAALAAKGAAGGASATSAVKGGAALLFAKWMGGGAAIGLVVSSGAIALSSAPTSQPAATRVSAPVVVQAPAPVKPVSPAQVVRSPNEPESVDVQSDDLVPPPGPGLIRKGKASELAPREPAAPGAPPPTASYASPDDGLAAEVQLLDQARAALSSGASTRALGLLAQHRRQYPRSRLANEAFVMRLDALSRSGQRDRARQMARAYLARQPNAPHAARIRRLVGLPLEKK